MEVMLMPVADKVIELISKQLNRPADEITNDKEIVKDLGAEYLEGNYYVLSNLEQKDFNKIIDFTRQINLPITHANAFLGSMNIFDSAELFKKGEEFVKRSFERFSKTDLKHITFGSGVSRASNENRSIEKTKEILF